MNFGRQIDRESLLRVLYAAKRTDDVFARAIGAVSEASGNDFTLMPVERDELLNIYKRRLSGRRSVPAQTLGGDRLLADLAAHPEVTVDAVTIEHAGRVTTIWLGNDASIVVGVISGLDQRPFRE